MILTLQYLKSEVLEIESKDLSIFEISYRSQDVKLDLKTDIIVNKKWGTNSAEDEAFLFILQPYCLATSHNFQELSKLFPIFETIL